MAGALDEINRLLDTTGGMKKQAYDEGRTANADYQRLLSKPGTDRSGLAFAAGLLKGGQGGNFGAELGQALGYYDKAAGDYENRELDRQEKIARLRAANAQLTGGYAEDLFGLGMKRFGAPGIALKYQDDMDELNGDDGIPVMTGPTPPLSPPVPSEGPPEVPPAPPPQRGEVPPNPNATVGQGPSFDPYQVASTDWQPPPTQPSGVRPDPQRPPEYPPELPMRVAQAPGGQPALPQAQAPQAPQAPSREQQLYDWAQQVRAAAAQNPGKWARRQKNQFALQQADKIIDDYDRKYTARGGANDPVMIELQKLNALEELKKRRKENSTDPLDRPQQEADLKRLNEIETASRGALETRQSNGKLHAARERLIFGEDWSTGGIMGKAVVPLLDKVIDTGKGAVDEAAGALRANVIQAQNSGAISNFEVKMFDQQVAGTGMGKETADWTMGVNNAIADRQQEQAKFYRRYFNEYGTLQGADEQWGKFVVENPIIDRKPDTGQPWLYAERAKQWQDYLKPPADLIGSGRLKNVRTDTAPGRQIPDVPPDVAIQELRRRGVIK